MPRFDHNSKVVCDCDVTIRSLIAVQDFKPRLKFLANGRCCGHLCTSTLLLGGRFYFCKQNFILFHHKVMFFSIFLIRTWNIERDFNSQKLYFGLIFHITSIYS